MTHRAFCRTYWGGHGCDLPRGHVGPHICLHYENDAEDNVRSVDIAETDAHYLFGEDVPERPQDESD